MSDYDKTHILHPANEKAFIDSFIDLYRANGEHINRAVEKSSKQARTVKLVILIDKSNGMPVFDSTMSMVTTDPLKDTRRTVAEDPDQMPLPLTKAEAAPKSGKKKAKK